MIYFHSVSAAQANWNDLCFLVPCEPCQVISRNGSKLRLSLPVSVVASFSSEKKKYKNKRMFLPQGVFSTELHLLKRSKLSAGRFHDCKMEEIALTVFRLSSDRNRNMFVLICELNGLSVTSHGFADFVELFLIGVVDILWCCWFKNITDVDYLTYLIVLNSFQCYNKIRLCSLWSVLFFLLRSLACLCLSADVLHIGPQ